MKASRKTIVFSALTTLALVVSAFSITAVNAQKGTPQVASPAALVRSDGSAVSPKAAVQSANFIAPNEGTDAVNPSLNVAKPNAQSSSNSPNTVFGKDNRKWVKNTTKYPYRAVAEVDSYFTTTGHHQCTAVYVIDNVLMTLGWCVYDPVNSEWAYAVYVYPAENGASYNPYGWFELTNPYTGYTTTNGWVADMPAYDWGFIVDPYKDGYTVGWMGMTTFATTPNPDVYKGAYTVTGYPDDKTPNYLQWTATGKIFGSDANYLYNGVDEYDQWGAPLYAKLPKDKLSGRLAGYYEVGVNAGGYATYNVAERVTTDMINDVIGLWVP